MPLTPIATDAFLKIAVGIDRPEDVVVGPDGRVFASDHQCAVAEIFADGSFKRVGPKGGAPNGLNMDRHGYVAFSLSWDPAASESPNAREHPRRRRQLGSASAASPK
ncbi:hypothetical protein [Phenylobacterium sp.]|uniref:hypothetical protein n=1 Tax=Phenylobacterium sp. TaxID=1871053 RepID=UPI0025CF3F81|nr:hypothetical protein [Phenylobacterium sp.]